jgi:hypothetical protein
MQGGDIKLRIKTTQHVSLLLAGFRRQLIAKGKGGGLPADDSAFRIEFDGDKLDLTSSLESAGVEDGDRLDVMWK